MPAPAATRERYIDDHGRLDTEAAPRVAAAAAVTAILTLMAFREGVLVFRQAGALPARALAEVMTSVKNLDMDMDTDMGMDTVRAEAAAREGLVDDGASG